MSQAGRKSGARLPPLRAGGSDEWLVVVSFCSAQAPASDKRVIATAIEQRGVSAKSPRLMGPV